MLQCTVLDNIDDPPPRASASDASQMGFTLIEIMAVVVIMGLLMGLVGVAVFGQVEKANRTAAAARISQIESALEFYRMDNARYPTSLEALIKRPEGARNYPKGGYMRKAESLVDPWTQPFEYVNPGEKNPYAVDLSSKGPDGISGTEDDVSNWTESAANE